jgi:hypothetical protein
MELAALIGITNEEFWEIEPYELSIYVKAFQKSKELNIKTQRNLLTMQAYQIAGWVWKRPSETELEKLLNFETEEDKKEFTVDDSYTAYPEYVMISVHILSVYHYCILIFM